MGLEGEQYIPARSIPVIDLSISENEIVTHVVKASEEWGIFQVVNHGISSELIQSLQNVGKQFFDLPEAEKKSVEKPADSKDNLGYGTKYIRKAVEGSSNAEFDYLFHNLWPPSSIDYSYWPTNPADYREVSEEYTREARKLSERILGWLSKGLGLRREALMEEGLGGESAVYAMKINNYPPCPLPEQVLGMTAHTDLNGLTLLIPNEIPGLQVFEDDHWFDFEYNPSAIVVILGDSMLRMSNGRYKNVLHRAIVDKDHKRMSWVVFLKPSYETIITPFPELIDADHNPAKFQSITYRDLKHHWLNHRRVN